MSDINHWKNFYKFKNEEHIPWKFSGQKLFDILFSKYDLPKEGNVLDVGTGLGKKAIYLSSLGYNVWAFDVTEEAFEKAKKDNPKINFFIANAAELDKSESLSEVEFDIVIDLVTSQFLDKEEKEKYMQFINRNTSENSYYILQTFFKGADIAESKLPWVNKVAQSKSDIEEIYGRYFEIVGFTKNKGPKGTVANVVLKKR